MDAAASDEDGPGAALPGSGGSIREPAGRTALTRSAGSMPRICRSSCAAAFDWASTEPSAISVRTTA